MDGKPPRMTEPDSPPRTTEPVQPPSLAFAFWGWFVAGGLAICILPVFVLFPLSNVLPTGMFSALAFGWLLLALPVYAVVALWKVWRSGCSAGSVSRWLSRSTVLAVYAFVVIGPLLHAHHMQGNTVRAKVANGLRMSLPALRAIDVACFNGTLHPELDHNALSLEVPGDYASRYTHSVTANVDSPSTATVEIVFKEIQRGGILQKVVVEEGATLMFTARCSDWRTTWALEGAVPLQYIPRRYRELSG